MVDLVFCWLAIAFGAASLAVFGFCLTDGEIRRAVRFALAARVGRVFAPRLLVVGDSLAAACPWGRLYRSPFAVLNLASGGATLKEIAGQIYRARDIPSEWLLIDGGLNDLLFDAAGLEQMEADFRALFRRVGARRAIVTLMPYVADAAQTARIDAANQMLSRLCMERGDKVIDLNPMISRNGVRNPDMTNDGLHFVAKAERIWIDAFRSKVEAAH
jgi:lysophospholipase L1-like esterase